MVFSLNHILNVSSNLQIAIYVKDESSLPSFFQWCWRAWVSLWLYQAVPQTWEKIFLCSDLCCTAAYSLKSEKTDLLILLNCEAANLTVFKVCSINFEPPDNDLCSSCHVYPLSREAWIISILFILKRFNRELNYTIWWSQILWLSE